MNVSGYLFPDNQINFTVQDRQEGKQLSDGFFVICLIEQAVELRRRCAQTANQFSFAERTSRNSLLHFKSQLVQQKVSKNVRVLIVLKDMVNMNCTFTS